MGAILIVVGVFSYLNKKGIAINYRKTIIGAQVVLLTLDAGATFFTIWNIVRSQWMWLGLPVLEQVPSGLDYVVSTLVVAEMTDAGTEDAMQAVVGLVSIVALPFGLTITKYIDALFATSNQDLLQDTHTVRVHASMTFLIAYLLQFLSLGWLVLLPSREGQAKEWKLRAGQSALRAVLLLATLAFALVWTVLVHTMSVIEATSCERIAGGRGC